MATSARHVVASTVLFDGHLAGGAPLATFGQIRKETFPQVAGKAKEKSEVGGLWLPLVLTHETHGHPRVSTSQAHAAHLRAVQDVAPEAPEKAGTFQDTISEVKIPAKLRKAGTRAGANCTLTPPACAQILCQNRAARPFIVDTAEARQSEGSPRDHTLELLRHRGPGAQAVPAKHMATRKQTRHRAPKLEAVPNPGSTHRALKAFPILQSSEDV